MTPLVSVLVPIYKVERYIERCARSVFEQTYENLEFVFVDDCSPDDSVKILERVAKDYPLWNGRIRILHHERNCGVAVARNTMLNHCKGEFLVFVDSDDWVELDMVELLIKRQQETDADIVTGRMLGHMPDGTELEAHTGYNLEDEALFKAYMSHDVRWMMAGRMIRTSLMKNHGIRMQEGINMNEDFMTLTQLLYYAKRTTGVDRFLYHYDRINTESIVRNFETTWDYQWQSIKAHQHVVDFFKDKEPWMRNAANKLLENCYAYTLLLAFDNHNRKGYETVLALMDGIPEENWSSIGWHRPLKRWLDHHYYLSRMVLPLRKLHGRVYQMLRA